MKMKPFSRWSRVKGPVAAIAVAGMFGVAVVAPLAMPGAQTDAEALAFQDRIHQEFTPNVSPEDDFVFTEISGDLSEAEQQRLADEETAKKKAEEEAESADEPDEGSSGAAQDPPKYTGGGSIAEWMKAAGIPESDWHYVVYIAEKESGINPNATNASSGACGLIQALPCSKVPGNGYDPVDNLRWADGYAKGRYGSWSAAYAFWTSNHWW